MVGPLLGLGQSRGLNLRVHVEAGGIAGFALGDVLEALGTANGFQPLAESSPALAEVLLGLDLDEVSPGDRRELELPDLGLAAGRLRRLGGRLGSRLAEETNDGRLGGCCGIARLAYRDAFLATLPMHDVRAARLRADLGRVDLGSRRLRGRGGSRRLLPVEMPDYVWAPTKVGERHGLESLDVVGICPVLFENLGAGEVSVEECVGGVAHDVYPWDLRSPCGR